MSKPYRRSPWVLDDGSKPQCAYLHCRVDVEVLGYCRPHYFQFYRKGFVPPVTCSSPGCTGVVKFAGLCSQCDTLKNPPPPPSPKRLSKWDNPDGSRKLCSQEGCSFEVSVKGFCEKDYAASRRKPPRDLYDACPVPGCVTRKRLHSKACKSHQALANRYTLSTQKLKELFLPSNRVCANLGCKSVETLQMDHDHSCCPPGKFGSRRVSSCGECIRGWLCRPCNTSLGQLREDVDVISGLLDFLERNRM